jgi:hypothetical protein
LHSSSRTRLDVSTNAASVTVQAGIPGLESIPTGGPIAIAVLGVALAAIGWFVLNHRG